MDVAELRAGLRGRPRRVPSKYFYDDVGSRLFDDICELPEYYLTRAEHALLAEHARAIAGDATTLLEIGSGMARKTGLLVRAMGERVAAPRYVPFDISEAALAQSARELTAATPRLVVTPVVGDFATDLARLPDVPGPRLFAFLGSTIGNLDEDEAPAFVRALSAQMRPGDRFALGVDLVKDHAVLHAAYNDAAGVTAAFNRNILRVISRELGGDIDADAFAHVAFYDPARARIEMHLEATRAMRITLRAIDLVFDVVAGERIRTEISRKFTRASVADTFARGGLQLADWFEGGGFGLALGTVYRSSTSTR